MEFKNVRAINCETFHYGKASSFTCMLTYGNNSARQIENVDMVSSYADVEVRDGMYFKKDKISMEFATKSYVNCSVSESRNNPSKFNISCFK